MIILKRGTVEYGRVRHAFFIVPALLFIIILLYPGCSRSARDKYMFSNSRKGLSEQLALSKDPIDRGSTYEIYFRLEKEAGCIEVNLLCSIMKNQFTREREIINTYYVVDRVINISSFSNARARHVFSELDRNYDENWNNKRTIRICSAQNDPIRTLDNHSLYRIRFTSFSASKFDFRITIKADTRILFYESLPLFPALPEKN